METKLKRPMSFLMALVVAMVFNFPIGITSGIKGIFDFGIPAKAEGTITPTPPKGSGTSADPYLIGTAENLYWFAALVNGTLTDGTAQNIAACAKLTTDITVNSDVLNTAGTLNEENVGGFIPWTPIGDNSTNNYTGEFDGAGYTISGLYFNKKSKNYVGLFGDLGTNGKIKNVGVIGSYFYGQQYVGGVCGYNKGTIENCYNKGIVSGDSRVGGVCGENRSTIKYCYNTAAVTGTASNTNVGGVCGYSIGTITNCYNTGVVKGTDFVGGVCGNNTGTITSCSNTGTVNGTATNTYVGGVCGNNPSGEITYCYNTGAVTGKNFVGGVIGCNTSTITSCYNTGAVTGTGSYVGGVIGCDYNNNNKITSCYYNSEDIATAIGKDYTNGTAASENCIGKTAREFASGEVCYLLNGSQSTSNLVWGQTLDNENPSENDAYPVFHNEKNTVYYGYKTCDENKPMQYANRELSTTTRPDHNYTDNNGFCKGCGSYQPAVFKVAVYEISNAGQLYWFAALVNGTLTDGTAQNDAANAKLTANITIPSGKTWTPIGTTTEAPFKGTFYGNKKIVSGITIVDSSNSVQGLFGCIESATVKNVGVENGSISGNEYIGGICGYAKSNSSITNCYNKNTLNGIDHVGGICGYTEGENITITNCYSTSGNICGSSSGDTVTNCYYLDTTASDSVATSKTTDEFGSGEVTYLLQSGQTADKNGTIPEVWGQTLTGENKQDYPVLGGAPVYPCTPCTGKYSNTNGATGKHTAPDNYDEYGFGKCKDCNADVYQPATLNNGVYEIGNAGQLYWFAEQVNGGNTGINAELTDNITVNTDVLVEGALNSENASFRSWTPIGNNDKQYIGTFNGGGHTISGLYFNNTDADYVGLFGYISTGGFIRNVGVVDSYFNGKQYVGGVFGYSSSGTIENCYNASTIRGTSKVGGVSGYASATIKNCYNTGAVSGESYVGGVCGEVSYCRISNCYYLGTEETDSIDGTTYKSTDDFKSGEVCYLLNGDQSTLVWGQTLGETGNAFPVFHDGTNTVYYGFVNCASENASYGNSSELYKTKPEHNHAGANYTCSICKNSMVNIVGFINPQYKVLSEEAERTFANVYAINDGVANENAESITVAANSGLLTVYFKLDDSFKLVKSYKLEVTNSTDSTDTITATSKCKTIFANIGMAQIVSELQAGTTYNITLTLYADEDCTTVIRTETTTKTVTVE